MLTPDQIAQANAAGQKASVASAGVPGMAPNTDLSSDDAFNRWISSAQQAPQHPAGPNPLVAGAENVVKGAGSAIMSGVKGIGQSLATNQAEQGSNASPLQKAGSEIATGADLAGKVTSLPFQAVGGAVGGLIPHQVKNAVGTALEGTANAITSNPEALHALNTINSLMDAHPDVAKLVGGVGTTALNVAGGEASAEAAPVVADAAATGANAVKTGAQAAHATVDGALGSVRGSLTNGAKDMALKNELSAWAKPTTVAKASYNKASAIYGSASSEHIPQTLVDNGVRLSDNIENVNGTQVYSTADTASKMRDDAAKLSSEALRPAIAKADQAGTFEKTPVDELYSQAEKNIQDSTDLTHGAKDTVLATISKEKAAMTKEYPGGLSGEDLLDNKILYDKNAKYSAVGDIATNNAATANKAIGDAARKTLEAKAPAEIPVHEFNAELGKQFQAANYLDALHGKPVPKSTLARISKTAAKVAGAATGHMLGGGILADVGGYHLGGMVESMLENLPNKARASVLNNLKVSNPEVFTKIEDYLNNRATSGSVAAPISTASTNTHI